MKRKPTIFLATFLVTMGLLLGASTAQAEPEVILDGNTATGIQNLEVGGILYNVAFLWISADDLYGPCPIFDFPDVDSAKAAKIAVNTALNTEDLATDVGPSHDLGVPDYGIGYEKPDAIRIQNANYVGDEIQAWVDADVDLRIPADPSMYADFTVVSAGDPVTIGVTVTGLEGSGLVLQNNCSDDLTITGNDSFTFDTALAPGTSYNVTVATNPTDPAQTCLVENGSGQVPLEDVSDGAVTCGELVVGNVVKVAAEGETLDDETILKQIILDGGVGINIFGKVAFGGRNGENTIAVFTQDGLVAEEGDTLPDETILSDISNSGEVAISAGQSGDRVAFHGQAETGLTDTDAVFTQDGLVAVEGGTLPDDTLVDEIKPEGKVAINLSGQVAFHGKTEVGDGFSKESFQAVFTSDGLAAREASELDDGTTLEAIDENGGVAINDFGDVAFHGDVVDPDAGDDAVKAVFTKDGLVAAEGDILPDGTILSEIDESGGVAINIFGDVAFHGRTDTVRAVFTQHGLVARVGDPLSDGTILGEIHNLGGVAINPYGRQVAFHGKVGTDTDVVLVGQALVVVAPAEGEDAFDESFSE